MMDIEKLAKDVCLELDFTAGHSAALPILLSALQAVRRETAREAIGKVYHFCCEQTNLLALAVDYNEGAGAIEAKARHCVLMEGVNLVKTHVLAKLAAHPQQEADPAPGK